MIYCGSVSGSGSYCRKVLVPVPIQVQIQTYLALFFNNKKLVQNLASSMLEAALFPRKLASNFLIFLLLFSITFYVGSGIGIHYGSGSAKAKSCGSFGSDSSSGSTKRHITWYVLLLSLKTTTGKKLASH
jgi:hypothetical protein